MSTPDFFCARLDAMVDQRHPLVVLAGKLAWDRIEQALEPKLVHQERPIQSRRAADLLGERAVEFGGGTSNAGRPRLPIRLMVSLLYLKNSFNLSDEELVQRWSENVVFQFFSRSGMEYCEPRPPCDATQIGRFRRAIGEEGLEQLLKCTIETAIQIKAVKPADLDLLVIDEIGYLSYSNRHADLLFELVSRRYESKSTMVTTNKAFGEWNTVFPNAACVVSLIDRLVHHSELIDIDGESYRLKEAKERAAQLGSKRKKAKP